MGLRMDLQGYLLSLFKEQKKAGFQAFFWERLKVLEDWLSNLFQG
jgi:hypothetical protein